MNYTLLSDSTLRNFQAMNTPAMNAKFGAGTTQAQNLGINYTGSSLGASSGGGGIGISSPEMMALQALGSGATAIGQNANKITQTVQGLSDEEYAIQSAKNPYGKSNTDSIGSQMSGIGSLLSLDIGGAVNHYSDVFAQSKDRKKMIDDSSSLSDSEKKALKFNNKFGSFTQMMGVPGLLGKVGMDSAFSSTQGKLEKELATNYNKEQIAHGDKLMGINRNAINIKALGGKLSNALSVNSLNPDIALTEVNAGSTHEGSPINGVPMGINQTNGQPNMVEQGETVVNNYVLSDRLKIDGKLFNGKFKNNTIADASKTLYKEIKERPNDPISKNTWNTNVGKLIVANEIAKQKSLKKNEANQFEEGGDLTTSYYNVDPKTGKINAGPYLGLTLEEARELNKGQRQDYYKNKEDKEIQEYTDKIRKSMNNAGKTIFEISKIPGSFTPAGPVIGLMDAYAAYEQGDNTTAIIGAGMEALPYGVKYGVKGIKATSPYAKKAFATNPIPTNKAASVVEDLKPMFKSEIDWAKWNKEIPKNKTLMQEYNAIEQQAKASGNWMKNPDGSAFTGTPEQFVQQNSKNFKKAFPEGFNKTYRGVNEPSQELVNNKSMFTANKELARNYTDYGEKMLHSDATEGGLYELAHPKSKNSYTLNTFGANWNGMTLNNIDKESFKTATERTISNFKKQIKTAEGVGNYKSAHNLEKALTLFENRLKNIDNLNLDDRAKLRNLYGEDNTTTNLLAEFIENKNIDYIKLEDIQDLGFGDVTIVNNRPGNYLKSLVGNNGMFDMTNPNIYKALFPAAAAVGGYQQYNQDPHPLQVKEKPKTNNTYKRGGKLK